jgi:hypothetical protein
LLVSELIDEVSQTASLEANARGITFTVMPALPDKGCVSP